MWKRISHPNIVPFLGVSESPAPLSMVSEWMPNGNVRAYVINNPEASRLQLVSPPEGRTKTALIKIQLLDISRGLSHLHSLDIVHGDLKGVRLNLLIWYSSTPHHLHLRETSSSTSRVARVSTILGLPASPVSIVQKLPRLAPGAPFDGWRLSSWA